MNWLPQPLPPHCKVVVTSIKSDTTYQSLSQRPDNETITIPLLGDVDTRSKVIGEHLAMHCKALDPCQLERIVLCKLSERWTLKSFLFSAKRSLKIKKYILSKQETHFHLFFFILTTSYFIRPLFLTTLANELRVFGVYSALDYHLNSYLEASSIRDLWSRIIKRWIKDYSWTTQNQEAISDSSEKGIWHSFRVYLMDGLKLPMYF